MSRDTLLAAHSHADCSIVFSLRTFEEVVGCAEAPAWRAVLGLWFASRVRR